MRLRSATQCLVSNKLAKSSQWQVKTNLTKLPSSELKKILGFFCGERSTRISGEEEYNSAIDICALLSIRLSCSKLRDTVDALSFWSTVPLLLPGAVLNLSALRLVDFTPYGLGGVSRKVVERGDLIPAFKNGLQCYDRSYYTLKIPKSFKDSEGVQYYLIREIAALKRLSHPNVLELIALRFRGDQLFLLYPYVPKSLHRILYPTSVDSEGQNDGIAIPRNHAASLMQQLMRAVEYCHSMGIIHRNLKPKNVLIKLNNVASDPLDGAILKITDFSFARSLPLARTNLTAEVTSLRYRSPELLMGDSDYREGIDIWSAACVYAEMLMGTPLFLGESQIDQLFQIFSKLGTPTSSNWPEFEHLRFFNSEIFPQWQQDGDADAREGFQQKSIGRYVRAATAADLELLEACLQCDPLRRPTAREICCHRAFIALTAVNQTERTQLISDKTVTVTGAASKVKSSLAGISMRKRQLQSHREREERQSLTRMKLSKALTASKGQIIRFNREMWERRCVAVSKLLLMYLDFGDKISSRSLHLSVALLDRIVAKVVESASTQQEQNSLPLSPDGVDGVLDLEVATTNKISIDLESESASGKTSRNRVQSVECIGSSTTPFIAMNQLCSHPKGLMDDLFIAKMKRSGGYVTAPRSEKYSAGTSACGSWENDEFSRLASTIVAEEHALKPTSGDSAAMPGTPPPALLNHPPDANGVNNQASQIIRRLNQATCSNAPVDEESSTDPSASSQSLALPSLRMDQSLIIDELFVISVTCLHIAAKFEDVAFISLQHLLPVTWRGERDDKLLHEQQVLTLLDFDVHQCTVLDFLLVYCDELTEALTHKCENPSPPPGDVYQVASFLADLCLASKCFLEHPYSLLATAITIYSHMVCIILAAHRVSMDASYVANDLKLVVQSLLPPSGHPMQQLAGCIRSLKLLHEHCAQKFRKFDENYSTDGRSTSSLEIIDAVRQCHFQAMVEKKILDVDIFQACISKALEFYD